MLTVDALASGSLAGPALDLAPLHLRAGGTSVVVDLIGTPAVVHWGEDLGDLDDAALRSLALAARPQRVSGGLDVTPRLTLLSTPGDGWQGTPGIEGHSEGSGIGIRWTLTGVQSDGGRADLVLRDEQRGLDADVALEVGAAGVFRQRITLRNTGSTPYALQRLAPAFPVPWDATELLDTTGRHLRERSAQRHDFTFGTHLRESRKGRPGADATLLLAAGHPGFGFETGRVHGIHVAWSGNHTLLAERVVTGEAFLAGGELYAPGEVILAAGDDVTTPWVIGSWGDGLNALSARFHEALRARPQHPSRPRPVTLNTWEAVYFDHSLEQLGALVDAAEAVGVERFVLDDGWFRGRRDDTTALGDWEVDPAVWPEGLHPLIARVHAAGMEFGLWVEPEMISPDSELARAHPDWILRARHELPPVARQQHVLDLARPEAYACIAERLHTLLDEYPITYLKWDHNRDLVDAGSGPDGRSRVHAHTLALYRLLDELKAAHPDLEIESCASGGARVDLGILERTDRIHVSDCLDPLERLQIQKYTGLVVPPELMGAHLSSPVVHSTGRTVSLDLAGAVAALAHFGIEWDLTEVDAAERRAIAGWVAFAKRIRPLVATGRVVHVDGADPGIDVRGMVAQDGSHAVFTIVQATTSIAYPPGRIRLPGLDHDRRYAVRIADPDGSADAGAGQSALAWAEHDLVLTGRQLATVGIRPPVQHPGHARVVEITVAF